LFDLLVKASTMGRRRKLKVVQHDGPSLAKEKSIDSSNEVNKEGIHIETHCKYSCKIVTKYCKFQLFHSYNNCPISIHYLGENRTRGYTHMLDVWDMLHGEFILVKVDTLGNPMGWEGKTLLNAIGSLVSRHQLMSSYQTYFLLVIYLEKQNSLVFGHIMKLISLCFCTTKFDTCYSV